MKKKYKLLKDTVRQMGHSDFIVPADTIVVYIKDTERYVSEGSGWYFSKEFVENNLSWFSPVIPSKEELGGEKIEVTAFPTNGTDCKNGMLAYTYTVNQKVPMDKFVEIRNAISSVLNSKGIDNEGFVWTDELILKFWGTVYNTPVVDPRKELQEFKLLHLTKKDTELHSKEIQSENFHKCQYCGAMTSQPDEQCWNNPKNHKFAEGEDDVANDFHTANSPTKEPYSKDWDILEFKNLLKDVPTFFKPEKDMLNVYLAADYYLIHSVLRKSDNEVFSIGDRFSNNHAGICTEETVYEFKVFGDKLKVYTSPDTKEHYYFDNGLKKLSKPLPVEEKKVLFVTEDGVEIFSEIEEVFHVFNDLVVKVYVLSPSK